MNDARWDKMDDVARWYWIMSNLSYGTVYIGESDTFFVSSLDDKDCSFYFCRNLGCGAGNVLDALSIVWDYA